MKPLPMIQSPQPAGSAIDPVCGMTVDPAHAAGSYEHGGKTYYFCNASCLNRFKADPSRYLKPAPAKGSHKDPVCGMDVDPSHAAGSVEHKGQMHYFCSEHCARLGIAARLCLTQGELRANAQTIRAAGEDCNMGLDPV